MKTYIHFLVRKYLVVFINDDFVKGDSPSETSHPPHIMYPWSSALVPFCAYRTDLNFSKNSLTLPGLTFPLCSSFLPTILNGQLGYKLTVNGTSGKGRENELMLLLDYNNERSLHVKMVQTGNKKEKVSKEKLNLNTAIQSVQYDSAKIHINTLAPYINFDGGIYKMTVVKRMSAKDDFLDMVSDDRNCEIELYEECRTRRLMKHCNCVPWEVPGFQVKIF